MAEYLIQSETLSTAADKIRECLNLDKYVISPSVIETEGVLVTDSVTQHYIEYIDCEFQGEGVRNYPRFSLLGYDFLENNESITVPVLYPDRSYGEPDYYQPAYYEGKAEIDGVIYDKWRMLQLGDADNGYSDQPVVGWDTAAKIYIYTNEIVSKNSINPLDFPEKINEVYETGYQSGFEAGAASVEPPTVTVTITTPSPTVTFLRYTDNNFEYHGSKMLAGRTVQAKVVKNTILQIQSTTSSYSISGSYTTISDTNPYTWVIQGDCTITGS